MIIVGLILYINHSSRTNIYLSRENERIYINIYINDINILVNSHTPLKYYY